MVIISITWGLIGDANDVFNSDLLNEDFPGWQSMCHLLGSDVVKLRTMDWAEAETAMVPSLKISQEVTLNSIKTPWRSGCSLAGPRLGVCVYFSFHLTQCFPNWFDHKFFIPVKCSGSPPLNISFLSPNSKPQYLKLNILSSSFYELVHHQVDFWLSISHRSWLKSLSHSCTHSDHGVKLLGWKL